MKAHYWWFIVVWAICFAAPARAEIVERELGTDASGKPVSGHVFQAGREFRRGNRVSGLPIRHLEHARTVRAPVGFGYWGAYGPYWWAPIVPLHCGGHGYGGSLTVWHGWGGQVSVTVIR